jgi:hypothetical protein
MAGQPRRVRGGNAGWSDRLRELASLGLISLSIANSPITGLLSATVWSTGVCYMWPTLLKNLSLSLVSDSAAHSWVRQENQSSPTSEPCAPWARRNAHDEHHGAHLGALPFVVFACTSSPARPQG